MKRFFFSVILTLTILLSVFSCKKDSGSGGPYSGGIFVCNYGFVKNNVTNKPGKSGSITYIGNDATKTIPDIYQKVNGTTLGGTVQSISIWNENAYILINQENPRIEVVDAGTFQKKGTINRIIEPRYFVGVSSRKAYVTSGTDDYVYIIDLYNNEVDKNKGKIKVGKSPEVMHKHDNYVYVANNGGTETDNSVTIIDIIKDTTKTIVVGDKPAGIVNDATGKIWVLCTGVGFSGKSNSDDTKGGIYSIDPANGFAVEVAYMFPSTSLHPARLVISKDGQTLYFLYDKGVYKFDTKSKSEPVKIISRKFYSLGYHTSKALLYCGDPKDYYNDGWVIRYDESGTKKDSVQTGVIPSNFAFGN